MFMFDLFFLNLCNRDTGFKRKRNIETSYKYEINKSKQFIRHFNVKSVDYFIAHPSKHKLYILSKMNEKKKLIFVFISTIFIVIIYFVKPHDHASR